MWERERKRRNERKNKILCTSFGQSKAMLCWVSIIKWTSYLSSQQEGRNGAWPRPLTNAAAVWAYLIKEEQSLKDQSRLFILFLPTLVQGPSIKCLVSSSTWPEDVALSNGAMWMYLDSGGQTDRQTSWDHGDRWGYRALPRICPKWCSLDLPKYLV